MRPHPDRPWHQLPVEETLRTLDTSTAGLNDGLVAQRLAEYGPNRLAERAPRPAWLKFLDQFRSLLVLILIGAAVLAGAGSRHVGRTARLSSGFMRSVKPSRAIRALFPALCPETLINGLASLRMSHAGT